MIPELVQRRWLYPDDVIGLVYTDAAGTPNRKTYWARITSREDASLQEFTLGSVTAQNTTVTWNEIQDANNVHLIAPSQENVINHVFWGVSPTFSRIFLQFPPGIDRRGVRGVRTFGGQEGYISGLESPLRSPQLSSELALALDSYPAFGPYLPDLEPSSALVIMSFYIAVYGVVALRDDKEAAEAAARADRVVRIQPGGRVPLSAPAWMVRAWGNAV